MPIKKLTACVIASITLAGCTAPALAQPPNEVIASDITIKTSPAQWYRFHTDVLINGVSVNCLVDTGAAETIYLDKTTSINVGMERASLKFAYNVRTVTGTYNTDYANIKHVSLGGFVDENIRAVVMLSDGISRDGHPYCILGMQYLRGFTISIESDTMTISRER